MKLSKFIDVIRGMECILVNSKGKELLQGFVFNDGETEGDFTPFMNDVITRVVSSKDSYNSLTVILDR